MRGKSKRARGEGRAFPFTAKSNPSPRWVFAAIQSAASLVGSSTQ